MLRNTNDQLHACFGVFFVCFIFAKIKKKNIFSAFQTNKDRVQVPMRIEIMKGERESYNVKLGGEYGTGASTIV